jgi:hypothetical protein
MMQIEEGDREVPNEKGSFGMVVLVWLCLNVWDAAIPCGDDDAVPVFILSKFYCFQIRVLCHISYLLKVVCLV